MTARLVLHSRWRATAPYRVRIGLALKGLAYETAPVDLSAGEQHSQGFAALNPQQLVPVLETPQGPITQSLAILEWLEETYPAPPLLPAEPAPRAVVRTMAAIVACEIHPLNNLRVFQAFAELGLPLDDAAQRDWGARWIAAGFEALEPLVARHGGRFAFSDEPSLADCFLIPQLWAASRFAVTLEAWPRLAALAQTAAAHPAFRAARPEIQPDAPAPP